MRSWLGVVALLVGAGCVRDDLVPCGDQLCPVDTVCVSGICADTDSFAACEGHVEGERCSTPTTSGVCIGGVCAGSICGNGIREPAEACDDGNQDGEDGCSERCDSNETCGNDVVDFLEGEQCDEGVVGLSGDGCSSVCNVELDLWRNVSPTSMKQRANPAVAYDSVRERLVVFGGRAADDTPLGDTWEWEYANWQLRVPVTSPLPREGAAMAYDPVRHRIVMFGGVTQEAGITLGFQDTWEWDGVTWRERATSASPSRRFGAAMTFDVARGRVVLFGGLTENSGRLADTWEWDGMTWSDVTPAQSPVPGAIPALAYDAPRQQIVLYTNGQTSTWNGTAWTLRSSANPFAIDNVALVGTPTGVVLFGGSLGSGLLRNDTYDWDGSNWMVRSIAAPPPARTGHALAYFAKVGRVVLFGGYDVSPSVWDLATSWTEYPVRSAPSERRSANIAYDARRGRAVLFGGEESDSSRLYADTWEWDGRSWLVRAPGGPAGLPSARTHAATSYDSEHGRVVMINGLGPINDFQDVWSYDGRDWFTHLYTFDKKLPGLPAAMAYVPARHAFIVVLRPRFAIGEAAPLETWQFTLADGGTPLPSSTVPMIGVEFRVAYDSARDRVVLYHVLQLTAETWEWDGTDWSLRAPASPIRHGSSFAYDPVRGRVVMFGGALSPFSIGTSSSFEWDGVAWKALAPALSPGGRIDATMWFDAISNRATIFGGVRASDLYDETWAYGHESPAPAESCVAGADTDADGLTGCGDPDCWARCSPLCVSGEACTATVGCGDGMCSAVEDYLVCPGDCPPPP